MSQPMGFILWRRGLEHEWMQLCAEDPRLLAMDWKTREDNVIEVIPIDPRHARLTIEELAGMAAYRCPPYKMAADE